MIRQIFILFAFLIFSLHLKADVVDIIKKNNNSDIFYNKLLIAVAKVESSLSPEKVGDNGKAYGLFQIHRAASKDANFNGEMDQLFDPNKNTKVAVKYLHWIYDRLDNFWCSVSAYNKGIGNITKKDLENNCYYHSYNKKVITFLLESIQSEASHEKFDH